MQGQHFNTYFVILKGVVWKSTCSIWWQNTDFENLIRENTDFENLINLASELFIIYVYFMFYDKSQHCVLLILIYLCFQIACKNRRKLAWSSLHTWCCWCWLSSGSPLTHTFPSCFVVSSWHCSYRLFYFCPLTKNFCVRGTERKIVCNYLSTYW
jgi:hypothetical protein